ncbi:MAG: DUF502 domain-containing protein [bacterium]
MKKFLFEIYANLRKHIFTGIITLIPLGITYYVVRIMVLFIYDFFRPVIGKVLGIQKGEYELLGMLLSFLLAAGIVYLVGLTSKHYLFRKGLHLGERVVAKIPFVKFFYLTTKQVIDTLTAARGPSFKKVVLTEFPKQDVLSLGFVTGESAIGDGNVRLVHVFMPTTPNPTTGFFMLVPADKLLETNLTMEEAFKVVMSGGLLSLEKLEVRPYTWTSASSSSLETWKVASGSIQQPTSPLPQAPAPTDR